MAMQGAGNMPFNMNPAMSGMGGLANGMQQ